MGRARIYASDAERQRAYRERLGKPNKAKHNAEPVRAKTSAHSFLNRDPASVRIRKLEGELSQERKLRAAAEALVKSAGADPKSEVARWQKKYQKVRVENRVLAQWVDDERKRLAALELEIRMPRATFAAIAKVLHSDTRPTDAERGEAMRLFNAWKEARNKLK